MRGRRYNLVARTRGLRHILQYYHHVILASLPLGKGRRFVILNNVRRVSLPFS